MGPGEEQWVVLASLIPLSPSPDGTRGCPMGRLPAAGPEGASPQRPAKDPLFILVKVTCSRWEQRPHPSGGGVQRSMVNDMQTRSQESVIIGVACSLTCSTVAATSS